MQTNIRFYSTSTCWHSDNSAQSADPLLHVTLGVRHEHVGTSLSVSGGTCETMGVVGQMHLRKVKPLVGQRCMSETESYKEISRVDSDCY